MRPVVILSTADMDAALWTNKQHIAVRLAKYCDVYYVESLGLRQPKISLSDGRRILRRLQVGMPKRSVDKYTSPDHLDGALKVLSPRVLPWHKFRLVRFINRLLLTSQVKSKIPKEYDLWSFSPVTYELEDNATNFVYHSVDLLHGVPGIPRKFFLKSERASINKAYAVVSSSKGVREHLSALGAGEVLLWENVADIELFRKNRSPKRISRAIFAGNMTPSKVDFALIQSIAESGIEVALAGPSNIDGSTTPDDFARLIQHPNITYLGVLGQERLAVELGRSTVGLIPYKLNEYTSGVFPMKVYEYLASGLRVVASPLPSLDGKDLPGMEIATPGKFAMTVQGQIGLGAMTNDGDNRFDLNSWDFRISQVRELLGETQRDLDAD